jgi:hypothetical protein
LYTDDEEAIFDAMKPVALSAIESIVIRGDAADRCVFLDLPAITEERCRDEDEFWSGFAQKQPGIFGALVGAVARGLWEYPQTRLERKPRMADFARWGTACEKAFWEKGQFMKAYVDNRQGAVEAFVENDPVAQTLRRFMELLAKWEGSTQRLLEELTKQAGEKVSGDSRWPKTPQGMTGRLRRMAPPLRKLGIDIKPGERLTKSRTLVITKTAPVK